MGSSIPQVRFGDLYLQPSRNGLTKPKAIRGEGFKLVNMGEIFEHDRLINIDCDRVPLSKVETETSLLEPYDLLFARQSLVLSGAGKCAIFISDEEPVTFESHLIRVRLNHNLVAPAYYYYLFRSPYGRSLIESIVEQGAGASGIRGSDLQNLMVPIPLLPEQRAIAAVLGALDDKIELNRRMNGTLEGMARALFRSWFVDFDPVRRRGAPPWSPSSSSTAGNPATEGRHGGLPLPPDIAALFPDEMEVGEDGVERPRGWRVGTLGVVAENIRRNVQPGNLRPSTPYIALEHMPRQSISLPDWGIADDLESNKSEFMQGDILFGKLRPYFHKVGVAPLDGVCSTDILVIRPKRPEWFGFLLGHVSSQELVDHTTALSTGTKMPRTSWHDIAQYEVVLPPNDLAASYSNMVQNFVQRIQANIYESRTLAALRDALLPRLMSGEVRVPVAEQAVADAL